jgi:hypothetical protein
MARIWKALPLTKTSAMAPGNQAEFSLQPKIAAARISPQQFFRLQKCRLAKAIERY